MALVGDGCPQLDAILGAEGLIEFEKLEIGRWGDFAGRQPDAGGIGAEPAAGQLSLDHQVRWRGFRQSRQFHHALDHGNRDIGRVLVHADFIGLAHQTKRIEGVAEEDLFP